MRFSSEEILQVLLDVHATGGSVSASITKLILRNILPAFRSYSPVIQQAFVSSIIENQQPFTTAAFFSIEQQHETLFQEAKHLLSTCQLGCSIAKDESLWWTCYLKDEATRTILCLKDNNKKSKDFCCLFCVPFKTFKQLVLLTITKRWYDPTRKVATGQLCSNVELLTLGVLHSLGKNAGNYQISMLTNISKEVHQGFFHKWCSCMASVMSNYIYMPVDEDEALYIENGYARCGLVKCIGSIDCVHIGWNCCAAGDRNSYVGKEGYPRIAYKVICSNDRKILLVTKGFPGTRGDKTIVKTDATVRSLQTYAVGLNPERDGTSWMLQLEWTVRTLNGCTKTFKGKYLICDGGFLRWPCLICGVPDAHHPGLFALSKVIAAA